MPAATAALQTSSALVDPGAKAISSLTLLSGDSVTLDSSGDQEVLVSRTRGKSRLALEISNTGAAALTACKIWARVNGGDWVQLLGNAAGDYTTPIGPLKYSFGANNAAVSPITLASGAKAMLMLDCQGYDDMRVTLNCGTATTVVLFGQAS